MKLRVNAPAEQATPLLERYAQLAVEIELAETSRADAIAGCNAVADTVLLPLVKERDELRAALEPWWKRVGATLLKGKRKTIELGGCIIGSKAGRAALTFALGDDKAAVATLEAASWTKKLVRRTRALDKAAIAKALEGKRGDDLRALGFSMTPADELFVLERAKQDGTLAG